MLRETGSRVLWALLLLALLASPAVAGPVRGAAPPAAQAVWLERAWDALARLLGGLASTKDSAGLRAKGSSATGLTVPPPPAPSADAGPTMDPDGGK